MHSGESGNARGDGDARVAGTQTVRLERAVAGGVVLGHDPDGRVVLASGGLPGELVGIEVDHERKSLLQGRVVNVLGASPHRVAPPCPLVARGCGGCDLQHADAEMQRSMRIEVVRDALGHLAGLDSVPVAQREPDAPTDGRTTMRLAVLEGGPDEGALALRHRRSHDLLRVEKCLVAHPLLAPVLAEGRFPGETEVTVRASAATGEVIVSSSSQRDRRAAVTEEVGGHRFRVSSGSFFQSGPVAAASLARAVGRALGGFDPGHDRLVDLYGGVGLFTVLLGARNAEIVERSGSAASDARFNTRHLGAKVVRSSVERWRPSVADAVVADPSRSGMGAGGVDAVAATGAVRVALVSCDPAAMGRDVSLMVKAGYEPTGVEVLDMFPHTHHVEAVTSLVRR
jgi:23S rRNA (uracil1939-C5)-methyltransferase